MLINTQELTSRFSNPENLIVKAKFSDTEFWKEKAHLISVSRFGTSFEIQKQCKVGQLLFLLIPMPIPLRSFDHDKKLYRIWGLVQHCHKVVSEDFQGFNVGVAFIGKKAPQSFYEKSGQSYRILGLNEHGLWNIIESDREFINRKHQRLWVSIDAVIRHDNKENDFSENKCRTENISKSGAAIFCETRAIVGDYVKFSCPHFDFETDAIVRNRLGVGNTTPKIHLEFLEKEFPVENIEFQFEE